MANSRPGGDKLYHCLYCYFTGQFSIILNEFSFNHLLLFLLLTEVDEKNSQRWGENENGPDYRIKLPGKVTGQNIK